jgi:hypothetical protein
VQVNSVLKTESFRLKPKIMVDFSFHLIKRKYEIYHCLLKKKKNKSLVKVMSYMLFSDNCLLLHNNIIDNIKLKLLQNKNKFTDLTYLQNVKT